MVVIELPTGFALARLAVEASGIVTIGATWRLKMSGFIRCERITGNNSGSRPTNAGVD